MHVFADAGGGVPVRQSLAIRFFLLQALGIMLEDLVQAVYRKVVGSKQGDPNMLEKLIGYVWVIAFLVCTTPIWVYPIILEAREEDAILSFASIKPLLFGRQSQ